MPLLQRNQNKQSDHDQASERDRQNIPRFAIGHMTLDAGNVDRLTDFYTGIGMRLVMNMGRAAIVELAGGTHIIIRSGEPGRAHLDFIVDDIDETHEVMERAGANPTAIRRGNPHDVFSATDPEGNALQINSTHAIGPV